MNSGIEDMHSEPSLSLFTDDETRWQALQTRNPIADGSFVYGVKTTKIFCRPTCKARLARRANVRFYATGEEAREAGFRPCKRCKPEVLGLMPEEAAVRKIRAFVRDQEAAADGVESGENRMMSLSQMARQTGLSKWHFHRVFKKCVGVTPSEYLKMRREAEAGGGTSTWNPGDVSGLEQVGIGDFDFDFGFLGDPLLGLERLSTEGSSATSECGPWSFDDFVRWPDKDG